MRNTCPCLDLYTCPHFLNRMKLEEQKDRALFNHPKAYDALLLQWETLFTHGYDVHRIDRLGFQNGEYALTPPESPSERPTEPVEDVSVYAMPPAPATPTGSFSVESHLHDLGAWRAGRGVPFIASPVMAEAVRKIRGDTP